MAIIKKRALAELSGDELDKKLVEWRVELARERNAVKTTGKPNNPGKMREFRRLIARTMTLAHARAKKTGAKEASRRKAPTALSTASPAKASHSANVVDKHRNVTHRSH